MAPHGGVRRAACGVDPNPLMILPFAIAAMPFIHKHGWEHHCPKVAVGLGLITVVCYVGVLQNTSRIRQLHRANRVAVRRLRRHPHPGEGRAHSLHQLPDVIN